MSGTEDQWKPLWERRDMDDRDREAGTVEMPTAASRLAAVKARLPLIGAALLVVFIVAGVMRAIFGLFSSASVSQPLSMTVCVASTVGDRVMVDLGTAFLDRQGAKSIVLQRDASGDNSALVARLPGSMSDTTFGISMTDSQGAFEGLAHGRCNVAIAAREMNPIEISQFHNVPTANPIALDGAVIVVHPNNATRSLTTKELRTLFSGQSKTWANINETGRAVQVVVPARGADEVSAIAARLLEGQLPTKAALHSRDVSIDVSGPRSLGAVGITTFHAAEPAKIVRVVDGGKEITASTLSIGRRTYPLTLPIYAYSYSEEPAATNAAYQFILFMTGADGQNVFVNDGFVSSFSF